MTNAITIDEKHNAFRPMSFADLASHDQHGEQVASFTLNTIPVPMLEIVGKVVAMFEKEKLIIDRSYSQIQVYLPPTREEIEHRLQRASDKWDLTGDQYKGLAISFENDPLQTRPSDYSTRENVSAYCRKIGVTVPWINES